MTTHKEQATSRAYRPRMPRAGRAVLLEVRDNTALFGWTDESVAVVQAARDAGWLLEEIGDVLGFTREFIRQLYERETDPAVEYVGFPKRPTKPKKARSRSMAWARRSMVSPEEIAELKVLQRVATKRRNGGHPGCAAAAEELYARLDHLRTIGAPIAWVSKELGLTQRTLAAGLGRYGYVPIPPSQPQVRTGQS